MSPSHVHLWWSCVPLALTCASQSKAQDMNAEPPQVAVPATSAANAAPPAVATAPAEDLVPIPAAPTAVVQTPELAAATPPGETATATAPPPQPTTDPATAAPQELADHFAVGHFAFGVGSLWQPRVDVSALVVQTSPANQPSDDDATDAEWVPSLEGRYWLGEEKSLAVDVGVSYFRSNLDFMGESTLLGEAIFGRVGVPIVLSTRKHTTFELIPQISYLGMGQKNTETHLSLFQWDAAVRLAAEIHFGFIGLPELSLMSGIGVNLSRQVLRVRSRSPFFTDGLTTSAVPVSQRVLVTEVMPFGGRGPWEIFVGNLSALYYL